MQKKTYKERNIFKKLIASGVHIGKKTNKWNPKTSIYLFGQRKTNIPARSTETNLLTKTKGINIHFIDIEQTIVMLRRAITFIQHLSLHRGIILYVPSLMHNRFQLQLNGDAAQVPLLGKAPDANVFDISGAGSDYDRHLNASNLLTPGTNILDEKRSDKPKRKWKGSSFRNIRDTIFEINKQRNEKFYIPQALFISNTTQHKTLIREAVKLRIPIIGMVDTNGNPYGIEFPIPGNTVSLESQELFTQILFYAISHGKKKEIFLTQQRSL